jgi:hypothetical protein
MSEQAASRPAVMREMEKCENMTKGLKSHEFL